LILEEKMNQFRFLRLSAAGVISLAAHLPGKAMAQEWEGIIRNVSPAVVFISVHRKNIDSTDEETILGSGFLIGGTEDGEREGGYGITVAHNVPEAVPGKIVKYQAAIGSPDAKLQELVVVERDAALDIALFRLDIPSSGPRGVLVDTNPALTRGAALGALGFTLGGNLRFTNGNLGNPIAAGGRWLTNLGLNKGDSGAPVFGTHGRVVGVAVGGLSDARGMTYVIPSSLLVRTLTLVPRATRSAPQQTVHLYADIKFKVAGVAAGDVLRVRSQPSADAPEISKLLPNASGLTKISCSNGWCRIAQDGLELGFVSARFLTEDNRSNARSDDLCETFQQEVQGKFRVYGVDRNDTLNIRKNQSSKADNVLKSIPPHASDVQVGACASGWCLVRYDGTCGYVAAQFLSHLESGEPPRQNTK
jgi:SH3-like domain-containing protein